MYEQAKGKDGRKAKQKEEVELSIYDAINTLVAHGHSKEEILRNYSREEISVFYSKCVSLDARSKADFIESVLAGIGGAFGGGKKIEKLLKDLRKI